MPDHISGNLSDLYTIFGEDAISGILPGDSFEVEGVEFVCKYVPGSTADHFYIVKGLPLVERYRSLCDQFTGAAIVELGIAEGGSTALIALLARPQRLIAVDIDTTPVSALAELIDARGLAEIVRPHYGVDQADRERLGDIVDQDLDGRPVDLVIDDCSHDFAFTRASFETLFPRLRSGGLYVIEDWNADHVMRDAVRAGLADTASPDHPALLQQLREQMASEKPETRRIPLTRLAIELVVARCSLTDAIAEVSVDEFWISVRRGSAPLDPATFRLSDHYTDHFGFIPPERGPAA